MKIFKPFLYCMLGFIFAFVLVFFFKNTKKMDKEMVIDKDVPIVELQVSTNDINVGDEVEYSIISRVEPDNEAFESNRTFYYDFEGDGTWDLITKKDTVTYTFIDAYEEGVTPRAAVEFRGKLGMAEGNAIYIKELLKPILMYNSIGNTVIFRDMSRGALIERQICFEDEECAMGNNKFRKLHSANNIETNNKGTATPITQNDEFIFNYNNYGEHNISIYEKDKYGNEKKQNYIVDTSLDKNNGWIASGVNMITIPETTFTNANPEIFLSKNMNNTLIMYINNESGETCYVDTDIAMDSDGDGKTDNDTDIMCNKLAKIKYEPDYESAGGRVYFMNNGKLTFKNFYVNFEGTILELGDDKKEIYDDITLLLDSIEDYSKENKDLKQSLRELRKNLNNIPDMNLVFTIKEQTKNGGIIINSEQEELLDSILNRLFNDDTIILNYNYYEKNKAEIFALLPKKGSDIILTTKIMFKNFDENLYHNNSEERAEELNNIRNTIINDGKKNNRLYNENDFTPYFCNIFDYFDIRNYTDKC